MPHHILAEHADAPGRRQKQAEKHGDGGGLTGAIGAQQSHGLAARHREGDIVDHPFAIEFFAKTGDVDHLVRHGSRLGVDVGMAKIWHGGCGEPRALDSILGRRPGGVPGHPPAS